MKIKKIIIIILLIIVFTIIFKSNHKYSYSNTKEMVVQKSNTLWTIANNICIGDENLNIQKVIADIKEINSMKSCDIYVGQVIYIPVYNDYIQKNWWVYC